MALPNAAERTQSDLAHLIHPLYHPTDHQEPRIWVEGRGALMKDINGVEVIDGLSGLWNVNIGHGRRELGEAAMQQMSALAYCSSYTGSSNLPAIELAERLSRIVYPSINTFFFTSGGGEATSRSVQDSVFLLENARQTGQSQSDLAPAGVSRGDHGGHECHRHSGLLEDVRATRAQFRPYCLAISVPFRGRRCHGQPGCGGGQSA